MLDSVIVPTILTEQPADFSKFLQLYPTFAKRIQIDVADGGFVATQTIQPNAITQLPAGVDFDFHLMVIRPSSISLLLTMYWSLLAISARMAVLQTYFKQRKLS